MNMQPRRLADFIGISLFMAALGYFGALAQFSSRLAVLEEMKPEIHGIYAALVSRGLIQLSPSHATSIVTPLGADYASYFRRARWGANAGRDVCDDARDHVGLECAATAPTVLCAPRAASPDSGAGGGDCRNDPRDGQLSRAANGTRRTVQPVPTVSR